MLEVVYIPHDQISEKQLDKIIKVKTAAWPYCYEDQIKWINSNIKNSDVHVLLQKENIALAYINLIEIKMTFDLNEFIGYGIGNVCALEKGKGWGKEILENVNTFLIENNKIGLLFCQFKLVKFYLENGWKLNSSDQVKLTTGGENISSLVFNAPKDFSNLKYEGILF